MIFYNFFIFFLILSLLTMLVGYVLKRHYIKKGMVINPYKILDFEILSRADVRQSNKAFKNRLYNLKIILIVQIAFFVLSLLLWVFTYIETDPRQVPIIVTPNSDKFP